MLFCGKRSPSVLTLGARPYLISITSVRTLTTLFEAREPAKRSVRSWSMINQSADFWDYHATGSWS